MLKMKKSSEEYKNFRMAVYEAKKEDVTRTYANIAAEFNINASQAQKLVLEYCKAFNLNPPEPTFHFNYGDRFKGTLKPDQKIFINGEEARVVREHRLTIIVQFVNEDMPCMIRKKTLERV